MPSSDRQPGRRLPRSHQHQPGQPAAQPAPAPPPRAGPIQDACRTPPQRQQDGGVRAGRASPAITGFQLDRVVGALEQRGGPGQQVGRRRGRARRPGDRTGSLSGAAPVAALVGAGAGELAGSSSRRTVGSNAAERSPRDRPRRTARAAGPPPSARRRAGGRARPWRQRRRRAPGRRPAAAQVGQQPDRLDRRALHRRQQRRLDRGDGLVVVEAPGPADAHPSRFIVTPTLAGTLARSSRR